MPYNSVYTGAQIDDRLERSQMQAWVNFNGTGTLAVRDSYNVSGVTDNGTGDYTVNFTNSMADTNYLHIEKNDTQRGTARNITLGCDVGSVATGSLRVYGYGSTTGAAADFDDFNVLVMQ